MKISAVYFVLLVNVILVHVAVAGLALRGYLTSHMAEAEQAQADIFISNRRAALDAAVTRSRAIDEADVLTIGAPPSAIRAGALETPPVEAPIPVVTTTIPASEDLFDQRFAEADTLEAQGRLTEATQKFYAAIEASEGRSERRVEVMIRLARIEVEYGLIDSAEQFYQDAAALAKDPDTRLKALLSCGKAEIAYARHDSDGALALFRDCEVLAGEIKDDLLIFEAALGTARLSPRKISQERQRHLLFLAERTGLASAGARVQNAVLKRQTADREYRSGRASLEESIERWAARVNYDLELGAYPDRRKPLDEPREYDCRFDPYAWVEVCYNGNPHTCRKMPVDRRKLTTKDDLICD